MSQQRGRPGTATLPGGGGKSHLNGYIDAESWLTESSPATGGCSRPAAEKPQETTVLGCSEYLQLSARCPGQEAGSAPLSPAATPASPSGKGPGLAAAGGSAGSPPPGRFPALLGCGADGPEAGPRPSGACAAGKGRSGPREAPRRRHHHVWGFSHLSASLQGCSAACGAGTVPPKGQEGDADLVPEAAQPRVPNVESGRTLGSGHRPAVGRQPRHGRNPARPLAEACGGPNQCLCHGTQRGGTVLPPGSREGIPASHRRAGSAPKGSSQLRKGNCTLPWHHGCAGAAAPGCEPRNRAALTTARTPLLLREKKKIKLLNSDSTCVSQTRAALHIYRLATRYCGYPLSGG